MGYTQEQIDRANQVNLEQFLRSQGEQLIKSGNEYRWKRHDSLTVKENKWFRHSQSKGGYPVDFVMEFFEKTFPEAVQMLSGEDAAEMTVEPVQRSKFRLPPRCKSNTRIVKYLTEERKLPLDLVEVFIADGLIYEDAKHHNVVFVGKDEKGVPRYAHCRGTAEKFRMDIIGSDKSYGFCYRGKGKKLFVFESPIDLLSHIALYPETEVDWLWYPYIPFGKLTIIQGNPGEGKTFFAMQLAAACTNRKFLPQMEPFEPFNVIFQTAEDGLGDTIKPRLISAEADPERVLVIDDAENPLTLADQRIEKAIRENNARLVIIDPLQVFLGANVDMNRANEVRPIFRRLAEMAQNTNCAIVMIGHLNKASGSQSTYRGLGSIDITAVVRSLLFIGKVKNALLRE